MGVHYGVALFLPAVGIEPLAEIALAVQQADADHRHPEAAGRFQMVPGQNPETARVLGQRLGDAELGRKVGHLDQSRAPTVLEPAMDAHVAAEVGVDLAQEGHESVVLGQRFQPLPGHEREHLDGVVLGEFPQVGVDPAEDVAGPVVPGPSQVERQLLQGGQRLRQPGPDGEAPKGFHLRPRYQAGSALYRTDLYRPEEWRPLVWRPSSLGAYSLGRVTTDDVRTTTTRRSRSVATEPLHSARVQLERIVVQDVRPSTPHGRPAKAVAGAVTPSRPTSSRKATTSWRPGRCCAGVEKWWRTGP